MIVAIIGLIAGLALGTLLPIQIPVDLARYTAIGILGILDSIFGALRADLQGKYDVNIFLSGLVFNMVLAIGITYLGDHLSLDLYLAAIVVFTIRIFSNLGAVRYSLIERQIGRRRAKEEIADKVL